MAFENGALADFFAAVFERAGVFLAGVEVVMIPNLQEAKIGRIARQTGTLAAQQNHGMCTDAFTCAHKAQMFSCGRLHPYPIDGNADQARNARPHRINVGPELGGLQTNGGVNIDNGPRIKEPRLRAWPSVS